MSVGIEDVAQKAGVSIATVSRVLADKPHVSQKARQAVLTAVHELGYRPNQAARNLRSQTSKRLGLLISDIQNPFFTVMARAVEDIAYEREYLVMLCNTDEDAQRESLYIDLMVSEQVAGVILSPIASTGEAVQQLTDAGIPVVLVDRHIPNAQFDSVVGENFNTTKRLILHLIEKGHKRIGAIIAAPSVSTGSERQEGYIQALYERGISFDPNLLLGGGPKAANGYELTQQLLGLPDPPTAIFSGNNLLTIGALRAIHNAGLSIPEQIALVAYDDMDWMFVMQPSLTVVSQPVYEMGKQAAQLMLQRIDEPQMHPVNIVLEPTILFRGSSGTKR
ncbi:MAG: LacI family DNA-binding transcriptional regulator [Chloroflexota bacterium]